VVQELWKVPLGNRVSPRPTPSSSLAFAQV
jgi:hypothetical protein